MELLRKTNEITDTSELSPTEALHPFLQVIRGDEVPASVTISSLQSIKRLLQDQTFSLLPLNSELFQYLIFFLTSCQFEASDQTVAEMVILEILHIFKLVLSHPIYGKFISDAMVCGICQVIFSICVHPKISDLLKKIAEQETIEILKIIFDKVSRLTVQDELIHVDEEKLKISKKHAFDFEELKASLDSSPELEVVNASFGFPCVREILGYLGDSLEEVTSTAAGPRLLSDKNKAFSTSLLKAIFTNGCHLFLRFKSCLEVVQNRIVKRLIAIIIENENSTLLFNATSVLTLAFLHEYKSLTGTLGIYIECLIKRISSNMGKVRFAETNEILLWSLYLLMKHDTLPMFIFQNFDCAKERSFLFDTIIKFLTTTSHDNTQLNYLNFLTLDILMVILRNFWIFCGGNETNVDFLKDEQFHISLGNDLQSSFSTKKQMQECAVKFNTKASDGINALKEFNFISSTNDHLSIAKFLFNESSLDGARVGLYLCKSHEFNKLVLLDFMKMFDFNGKSIDQALRLILSHFRLPGEAQQIWNIIDAFSIIFISHDKEKIFKSKDSVFVLAYSIIMLNTDLHNPKVKNKMKLEEFLRNNLSVNDGENFSEEYLTHIYEHIKGEEIVFPEEQNGLQQFNHMWKKEISEGTWKQKTASVSTKDGELSLDPKLVHILILVYLGDFVNASFSLLKETKSIEIFNECREIFFILFTFCKHFKDYSSFESILGRLIEHVNNSGFDIKDRKFVELLRFLIFIINQNITLLHIQGWMFLFDLLEKLFTNNLIPKNFLVSTDYKQGQRVLESTATAMKKQSQSNIRIISALTSILTGSSTSLTANNSDSKTLSHPENWNDFVLLLEKDGMLFDFLKKSTEIPTEKLFQVLDYLSNEKFIESSCVLFVEIYVNICIKNYKRIDLIYDKFKDSLEGLFVSERSSTEVKERIIVGIVRLAEHLLISSESSVDNIIIDCLNYLKRILDRKESRVIFSLQIAYGLQALCRQYIAKRVTSETLWIPFFDTLKNLLPSSHEQLDIPQIHSVVVDCISLIVEYQDCLYFDQLFDIINSLYRLLSDEQIILSLFQSMFVLFNRTLVTQNLNDNFKILSVFSKSLLIPTSKSVAITSLQRALLHSDLLDLLKSLSDNRTWIEKLFFEILFPCMLESSDTEIRQRLVGLSSKIFLQSLSNHLVPTENSDLFMAIWSRLLEMYHLYYRTSSTNENDLVREAVAESLKNLVLVLINLGILSKENEQLWNEAWLKIKEILPSLYLDYHQNQQTDGEGKREEMKVMSSASSNSSRSRVTESEEVYL